MPEYLLNQQTRAVHEKADHRADEAGDGPEGPDQSLEGAGTEDAMELLARQAEAIRAQVTRHSTEHFVQRLAARLASESKRPTRVQYASAGAAADTDPVYPEEMPEVTQPAPPASGPSPRTARPDGRPHLRPRSRRRHPTPINPFNPKGSQWDAVPGRAVPPRPGEKSGRGQMTAHSSAKIQIWPPPHSISPSESPPGPWTLG
ncbi:MULTISPECIES: hypothetical protein [unclassified Streptomyces]|uniref:hypothetical protein n=1 Tax=unclassified Streptomyces TaxID=2593676 RepID=UPI00214A8EF5|nr:MULTISPECIES: hypothetical protein [unclassified Streptomyces]